MTGARLALVTGASGGIGRAVALALARDGWDVALSFLSRRPAAEELARQVIAFGRRAAVLPADLADPSACRELALEAGRRLGPVDALVHAAGLFRRKPLLEEEAGPWERVFAVNLHSLLHLATALAPGMVARGRGRIVAFGVAGAETPRAWREVTAHHVSKLGLVALARSLARELAATGVTVNVVAPGFVDSGGLSPEELARGRALVPGGRLGRVEDVAAAVLFLLSDSAGYVTGATIPVAGGSGL